MVSGENPIQLFVPNASCGEGGGTDGARRTKQVPAYPALPVRPAQSSGVPQLSSMITRNGRTLFPAPCNPLAGGVHSLRGSSASSKNSSNCAGEENSSRRSPQPSRLL